jgi:hypothetical protein
MIPPEVQIWTNFKPLKDTLSMASKAIQVFTPALRQIPEHRVSDGSALIAWEILYGANSMA